MNVILSITLCFKAFFLAYSKVFNERSTDVYTLFVNSVNNDIPMHPDPAPKSNIL